MTCTTHHHACACREARFEAMFQAQEARVERLEAALLQSLNQLEQSYDALKRGGGQVPVAILRTMNKARAALAAMPKEPT